MDTFQQTIANVTGGDFIGKIIVAIIILVSRHYLGYWYLLGAGCLL